MKSIKFASLIKNKVLLVLFVGLMLRLSLSFYGTLNLDQNTFIAWSNSLILNGFAKFYQGWSDYLPGYLYILWLLGKIKEVLPIPPVVLYKLPAIISDLLTGYLIYKIVSGFKNYRFGLIAMSLYVFNPAIFANSTLWGQIDSITSLLALSAVYFLSINPVLSCIFLVFGTLIKPQVAFISIVLLVMMIWKKWKVGKILLYVLSSFVIFVLGFLPFSGNTNLAEFILKRLAVSFNQYPYSSLNAFNFWGLFGFWRPDTKPFPLIIVGGVILIAVFVFSLSKLWKRPGKEYLLSAIIFLTSFLFLTRIHERHLLPVFAPLLISVFLVPDLIISYLGLSLTYIANLFYSFNWLSHNFSEVFSPGVIVFFTSVNLGIFAFLIWKAVSGSSQKIVDTIQKYFIKFKKLGAGFNKDPGFPKIGISRKTLVIILGGVLVFALTTRVFNLGNPPSEYFDEVYHAFTARQILHGNPMAWEWWNTPPAGFAYEWTHPPLAKLGMVWGMILFGENAFGWRIIQAVLGTLSVFLVYLIAKEVFKDQFVGILSAAVFSLDGIPLVMSRIGMNDAYMLFFVLLALYFFLKEKDFLSAVSFGLAISSKWSTVWLVPILFILWIKRKNKIKFSLLWFFILSPAIYLLSYLPMFFTGHNLSIFWGMQEQMWWYHTNLKATHPYMSSWWTWPFLIRPVYLYTSDEIGGMVARIYIFGNPAVCWFGVFSAVSALVYSFLERNKKLALIVFSYLVFFVPWAISPRIMFLYHYLPAIPFMSILIAYVLRRNPKLLVGYFIIAFLVFIYFFPHWIGLKIPLWWDSSYYVFPSWR